MQTRYFKVDPDKPQPDIIAQATEIIRAGELVAFPTETVYGLGANAFSSPAVEKIYLAKNRPPINPLLIHVSNLKQVERLVETIPDVARELMQRFWPGPLSLVLPALSAVPDIVRAGSPGVGLRMPSHPVALALIDQAGPIAAPSANLSGRPSPVTGEHVRNDLDGRIAAVLDAGPTGLGIESTVLDLTGFSPAIIRRGSIPLSDLESILGQEIEEKSSSGQEIPHYQTTTQVVMADNMDQMQAYVSKYRALGKKIGVVHNSLCPQHTINHTDQEYYLDLETGGTLFYSILRDAEKRGISILIFAPLSCQAGGIIDTLLDRIKKAGRFK
ncbi:L-threonylcarbamoyladenylate synthase [Syntrophomonas erecta subsp. sporosyntropha]